MVILINDQQYHNILLNKIPKRKIKLREDQFKRLLLREQENLSDKEVEDVRNFIKSLGGTPDTKTPVKGTTKKPSGLDKDDEEFLRGMEQYYTDQQVGELSRMKKGKDGKWYLADPIDSRDGIRTVTIDGEEREVIDFQGVSRKGIQGGSVPNPCEDGCRVNKRDIKIYNTFYKDFGGQTPKLSFDANGWSYQCLERSHYNKIFPVACGVPVTSDPHLILPTVAAIAIWFGPAGWIVAGIAEGLDFLIYAFEGDAVGAALSLIFFAIPTGGVFLRRIGKKGVKKIANLFTKYSISDFKLAKGMNNKMFEYVYRQELKHLRAEAAKTLTKVELEAFELLLKNRNRIGEVAKMSRKEIQELVKANKKVWEPLKKVWYGWGQGSKFLRYFKDLTYLEKFMWSFGIGGMWYLNKSGKGAVIGGKIAEFIAFIRKIWGFENIDEDDVLHLAPHVNNIYGVDNVKKLMKEREGIPDVDTTDEHHKHVYNIFKAGNILGTRNATFNDTLIKKDYGKVESIVKAIENSPVLREIDFRDLQLECNWAWIKENGCDKYDELGRATTLTAKREVPAALQKKIEIYGDQLILKTDPVWEYRLLEGLWYGRKKSSGGEWKYIGQCSVCTQLQIQYNRDNKIIDCKAAYEYYLQEELDSLQKRTQHQLDSLEQLQQ